MSDRATAKDVVLIGLGGAGIRTVMAVRALIKNEELLAGGDSESSCRLLAIDSSYVVQDYFRDADEVDRAGVYLSQDEYLGLLRNGENPWDKVTKDAKSNIPEAERLLSRRPSVLINRAPDRNDYEAMIYVSRERMKQEIRDFLKNSEGTKEKPSAPLRLVIVSSLIGDTGSLSYLELLKILPELSEEIRFESISVALFGPDVFEGFFHLQTFHTAKYFSVLRSIAKFCFKIDAQQDLPNHYLISLIPGTALYQFPRFAMFTETAKKLHKLIIVQATSENEVQDHGKDSMIEMVPLDLEKWREIEKLFVDRLAADRHFSQLVRDDFS
jgi:hypothetical protein